METKCDYAVNTTSLKKNCRSGESSTSQSTSQIRNFDKKRSENVQRLSANLKFEQITYTVYNWSLSQLKRYKKEILHGVSGEFKSGELSVIMGPSGAGKTTLLNILSGFTMKGSGGKIYLNEIDRARYKNFRKLSGYIPDDGDLRLNLTVLETMTVAAHLKLGYQVSHEFKHTQIFELLETLRMTKFCERMVWQLSGGERKRLSIAMELISDPSILFLDEPTTGLDSLSSSECISLLKRMTKGGRTIICTLHQPSALIFEKFDNLYALADGRSIYQGASSKLLPFFTTFDLHCPPYHNPADFLIEVANGDHDVNIEVLANEVERANEVLMVRKTDIIDLNGEITSIPASIFQQFLLLYRRNFLMYRRNYKHLLIRIVSYLILAISIGLSSLNVGRGANTVYDNYGFWSVIMLTISYIAQTSVSLYFPLEEKILLREHFNGWYKLGPYLVSAVLTEMPFQLMCSSMYLIVTYWLTDQPLDFRAYLVFLFCTLTMLTAQAWGYFIGAIAPIKIAVFLGPVVIGNFAIFGFHIPLCDTPLHFQLLYYGSYLRAAFHNILYTLYNLDREKLFCPEKLIYCHYTDPLKFLREVHITDVNLVSNTVLIVISGCVMYILTYFMLWFKLTKR